ncbi:MAG: glycoside hydrolase family 125 protein [Clostridia bacterium]|nr:glycoside hydrolase family 125 protein [Clostridia bacterium]
MSLTTAKMKAYVADIQAKLIAMGRPKIAEMFPATYLNTIETTVKLDENGAFVITGDVPAMWLRDSSAQVRHYLPLTKDDPEIRSLVASLVKRQALCIINDPYANAFNRTGDELTHWGLSDRTENNNPMAWERKYEVDSLCYPVNLAYHFWKASGTADHLDETFKKACETVLDTFETEQYHAEKSKYWFTRTNCPPTDTLRNDGKGPPVAYTGMTWSGFRPSDDACDYHYLIPSEMFASVILGFMTEIAREIWNDGELEARAAKLKAEIDAGIEKYATVEHPEFGRIYAYETDGLGNHNLMDDANVPSLLSLPYLGYCAADDEIYANTRRFILSPANPYYFEGTAAKGIGSPHTPKNYIWHVSLAMQGLTTTDPEELNCLLDLFETTTAGTGLMHEGFHVDNPDKFTREWFAWANSIFAEFVIHTASHCN